MSRRPPRSTRTDPRFPYTTLFRSAASIGKLFPVEAGQQVADAVDIVHLERRIDLARRPYPELDADHLLQQAAQLRELHVRALRPRHLPRSGFWRGSEGVGAAGRSEEHTSELQSLMRISYAVFC